MNKNNECDLICDLLPSYVDGLLSEYSTEVVEEHLNECESCKQDLEEMNSRICTNDEEDINCEAKKLTAYLKKVKTRNIIIGILIATTFFSVVGVSSWGWYKSTYLAASIPVPSDKIVVLDLKDNEDGTIYVRVAADTDYRVSKWTWSKDENNPELISLQMFHSKKVEPISEENRDFYDGYGLIVEATIVVDTMYHEYNVETGMYPTSTNNQPQNEYEKNLLIYSGTESNAPLIIWQR